MRMGKAERAKDDDEDGGAPFLLLSAGRGAQPCFDPQKEISNFGQIISHSGIRDGRRIWPPPSPAPRGRSISDLTT